MLAGHDVRCFWLNGSNYPDNPNRERDPLLCADLDFEDIDACTHFVMFNLPIEDPEYSRGRMIEFGYAVARGKRCILVGGKNNESVFFSRAAVHFETVEAFLAEFAPEAEASEDD